jgi:hypothetical protein
VEVYALVSSPEFSNDPEWITSNSQLLRTFLTSILEFSLFGLSFQEVSSTSCSIEGAKKYLTNIHRMTLILLDKLCTKKTADVMLEVFYEAFRKELGYNVQEERLFFRIVHSLNDPGRSKRICFLLDQIKVVVMGLDRTYPSVTSRIHKLMYEVLFLCNAPSVIKSCSSLQGALKTDKIAVKSASNSYSNTFQIVNPHKLTLHQFVNPKSPITFSKNSETEILNVQKVEGFLEGKADPSLMGMLLAKMGRMLDPSSEINPDTVTTADLWRLIDVPILTRSSTASSASATNLYRCIIHQSAEINLIHLVKVIYHLDQQYELVSAPVIENWKKYKEVNKIKMSRIKKVPVSELSQGPETSASDNFFYKVYDTTLEGIPHSKIASKAEKSELPIGWYLNSIRNFADISAPRKDKKLQDKRKPSKQWASVNDLAKILDRIKLAQEKIVEPKETDTDEVKEKFIKEFNALLRYNELVAFVCNIGTNLNRFGFAKLQNKTTLEKATAFALSLEEAIQGKVKPVSYDHFSTEVKNILAAKDAKETQPDSKIDFMPVTVCNSLIYYQMKDIFDKIFPLNHGNNRITEGLNNNLIISTSLLTGSVRSEYLNRASYMLRKVYSDKNHPENGTLTKLVHLSLETLRAKDVTTLSAIDRNVVLGSIALIAGWEGSLITGSEVRIKNSGSAKDSAVIKAPQNSGKLGSIVINHTDENISTQYVNYDMMLKKIDLEYNILSHINIGLLLDGFVKLEDIISTLSKEKEVDGSDSAFIPTKWSLLISLRMVSSLLVQSIYGHPQIGELTAHPAFNLIISKSYESLGTPSLRLVFRKFISWENIVDRFSKLTNLIFHPKSMSKQVNPEFETFMITETKTDKEISSLKNTNTKEPTSYRLPASSYIDCLPRSNPKSSNYKMVKHWEKFIIPKVENFVRSSFSDFQMKDFFEQLRMSLRVMDHIKASGIAFRLCDWGLPNGCVLPDADYDWDTIDIEDIEVGSLVSVKLQYRNVILSNKISHLAKLGLEEVVGEVVLVEPQLKYVLVLLRDDNLAQMLTVWAPQQCINPIEYPVDRQGHSYSYKHHCEEFGRRLEDSQTYMAQNILIKTVSLESGLSKQIDSYKVIKWLIISEFNSNLISGWLGHEQRMPHETEKQVTLISKVSKKEKNRLNILESDLYKLCKEEAHVDYLIKNIQDEAAEIVKLLNENSFVTNLKDKLEIDVGQSKHISPLNIFELLGAPKNSVCSIAVTFDKPAYLGLTSGVKFFSDKNGVHLVNHILNADKDLSMSNIPPILFQSNEIYYQSYYSTEGVPPWKRDQVKTDLPCVVHGIPYSWTPCCWMIDTLSSVLIRFNDLKWMPKINELLKIVLKLSQEIKGPSIIKQMLYMLSNRLVRKVKCLIRSHQKEFLAKLQEKDAEGKEVSYIQKLFDVDPSHVDNLLAELKTVLEIERDNQTQPNDKFPLYSAYTQDLIELLAAILAPMVVEGKSFKDTREKPAQLESLISFSELIEYFNFNAEISQKNEQAITKGLSLGDQHRNFVLLNNIPRISKGDLVALIKQTLGQRGGRLVSAYLDIYVAVDNDDVCSGMAVIFVEGWNIPESDEDLTFVEEKVEEVVEEVPPAPEEPPLVMWICQVCTLQNEMGADICGACDSPKPPNPELVGDNIVPDEPPKIEPPAEDEMESVRIKVWHSTLQLEVKKLIDEKNRVEKEAYDLKVAAKLEKEAQEKAAIALKATKKSQKTEEPSSPEVKSPEPQIEEVIPQPKIIDNTRIDLKFGSEILNTNECIEAILNRTVMDEFQKSLDVVLKREYQKREQYLNECFGVTDLESFMSVVKDCEPQEFIQNLASIGIDFWLDKVIDHEKVKEPVSEAIVKEIIQMVEKDICNESRFYSYFKSKDIRVIERNPIFTENNESANIKVEETLGFMKIHGFDTKFPLLSKFNSEDLRALWEKIALYNTFFMDLLPLINMSSTSQAKMEEDSLTLGGSLSALRYQCLSFVKSAIKTEIMNKTSLRSEVTPTIKVERLTEESEGTTKDETGEQKETVQSLWKLKSKFTFLRAFEQMKKIPLTMLRPEKVKGSGSFVAFKVVLEGENVQGLAGPYRQFFADISAELQPVLNKNTAKRSLAMFIPTPNAEHKFGEDRHKFTINPSANTSFYLQLFETLGVLMGCAMRTDSHFTLDLPSLLWKKIIGEEVTMTDMERVDKHFVENLRHLESCDAVKFEQMGIENFTTKLSDGSVVELMPNGSNIKMSYERRLEYMELSLKARLEESSKQIEAISKGLKQIVPEPYFNIINHKDLELEICGTNLIDFKLLRRNTVYSGGILENSDLIRNFWQVLEEMKETDKLKLIKFCWGQERLPASDDEYKRTQTRFMIKPSMSSSADQNGLLPKADTCFFNLELPNYSTKEIMQSKLILVINLDCDSMNAEIVINELADQDNREYDDYE